jgi:hypothetical protein
VNEDGVPTETGVPATLGPGTVAFVDSGDVPHEDFVNYAWTSDPITDVLTRVSR